MSGNEVFRSDAWLGAIAENAFDIAHCWCTLLKMEMASARRNLRALVISALVLPVLARSEWLSLIALISVAIHRFTGSWLLGAILQVSLLTLLLRFWLRWALNFTLPQSRAALRRAMERMS